MELERHELERRGEPRQRMLSVASHADDARQGGQDRVLTRSLERESAAEEIRDRAPATRLEPELGVDRILRQQIVEPERPAGRIVPQRVRVAAGENHKI